MGHIINDQGLCADPDKVKVVVEMARPEDVQAVQCFIGMINYLSKFLDKLSEVCEPLHRLCDKDRPFDWPHDAAFEKIKKAIAEAPVLRFYDVTKPVTVESLWVWVQFSLKTASRSATPVELCPRLSRITTSWRRSASLSVSPWRNLTTMFLGSTWLFFQIINLWKWSNESSSWRRQKGCDKWGCACRSTTSQCATRKGLTCSFRML